MLKHLFLGSLKHVSTLQPSKLLLYFCFKSFSQQASEFLHPIIFCLILSRYGKQIIALFYRNLFVNGKLLPHLRSAFHFHELMDPFPSISP